MSGSTVRVRALVRGRVQQVGFRVFVLRHARALDLRGTVGNLPDGALECVVEGERAAVDRMLDLLRQGPPAARVDAVQATEEPVRGGLLPMRVSA